MQKNTDKITGFIQIWGFPTSGDQSSPCLSILSHNLIICMMWGYLHDLGNRHFMGFKPYHVAICCFNIIEWYCGSLRSSISSSHQSHSHAITCCDGGRGLWIDGCPAGPAGGPRGEKIPCEDIPVGGRGLTSKFGVKKPWTILDHPNSWKYQRVSKFSGYIPFKKLDQRRYFQKFNPSFVCSARK